MTQLPHKPSYSDLAAARDVVTVLAQRDFENAAAYAAEGHYRMAAQYRARAHRFQAAREALDDAITDHLPFDDGAG